MVCCFSAGAKWGCHEWEPTPFTPASICLENLITLGCSEVTASRFSRTQNRSIRPKCLTFDNYKKRLIFFFYRWNCVRASQLHLSLILADRCETGERLGPVGNKGHYGWREPSQRSLLLCKEAEVKPAGNGGGSSCCNASLIDHMSQGVRARSHGEASDSHVSLGIKQTGHHGDV